MLARKLATEVEDLAPALGAEFSRGLLSHLARLGASA
jgi:hypothetical protein